MANAQGTTTNLSAEMQIYYDKVFLERSMSEIQYNFLAVKKTMPKNSGKVVYFTRQTAFTPTTAALTEGTTPTGTPFSSETVSAQVAEYGDFTEFSSLFELTTIDSGLKEKVETMGQYAGEKMNKILLYTMAAGATEQYVCATLPSANYITAVTATDVLTVAQLRKAVLTLKTNKAPKWDGGVYRAVLSAQGNYELQGDSAVGNFTTINVSSSPENVNEVKSGEVRRIAGIDCKESNEQYTQASTVTVYSSFVGGKGAVGEVDIAGSANSRIIYKDAKSGGTSNPLEMVNTLAWKVDAYAAKILNADWIVEILHA